MSGGFNLSSWALKHQSLVRYLMVVLALAGAISYTSLGRSEDPDFTLKTMVISASWPGASAREVELQITDRIEKKLQEVPWFDYVRSYSKPGEAFLFINLKDSTPKKAVADAFYQVRKKIGDIRGELPQGTIGPFFNDEFGDTYGNVYAFTADGFSHAELRDYVQDVRQLLLEIPDVQKVELVGVQPERIWVEFSNRRLALLGLSPAAIFDVLQRQNAMVPAGSVETGVDRVYMRVTGDFDSVEAVRNTAVSAQGRSFRLGDIAEVRRGYADPPGYQMRWNGKDAIGLTVSMRKGGNVLDLGSALNARMDSIEARLPVGVTVERVADQPRVVKQSIGVFMQSLGEAIGIVLVVSFLTLGFRSGAVVALSIPLVLACTALAMKTAGIDLHRISLNALIIALGLFVDDAIIATEMMVVKMEQGMDRMAAAAFAYKSTAFPMLTGTLITAAGFMPVGLAESGAGEYSRALFSVVGMSLIISWVVAVFFTPYLGYKILPDFSKRNGGTGGAHGGHDVYNTRFYLTFRRLVAFCVLWRKSVLVITLAAFLVSLWAFQFVPKQFFPGSTRPELFIELRLPEGASVVATKADVERLEKYLATDADVVTYASYIGGSSPRFFLSMLPEFNQANYAQFVLMTTGDAGRDGVKKRLETLLIEEFPNLRGRIAGLENGPPVGWPVQFRVSGPDPEVLRTFAQQVRAVLAADKATVDPFLDWTEKSRVLRLEIDQDKARALGVDSREVSMALASLLTGTPVTEFREGRELIPVMARAVPEERLNLGALDDIFVPAAGGRSVPLAQVAHIVDGFEDGVLWRRNRLTTITVKTDIIDGVQAPDVSARINVALEGIRQAMPDGYRIEMGGSIEESAKGQGAIGAVAPWMLITMMTVLMLMMQSFQRTLMVFLTAPFGLIGVTLALLVFNKAFGFMAMLGVIALMGMIMRNSVILVDQIEQDIRAGHSPYEAVIGATVRRSRPICLTAAASVLAMIPLIKETFFSPMAVAIMGGLVIATVLTLLSLPALYAAWFRVKVPVAGAAPVTGGGSGGDGGETRKGTDVALVALADAMAHELAEAPAQ